MRLPRLRTLLVAVNLVVLALPLAGLGFLRLYESALIRQTEPELVAQARDYFVNVQQKNEKYVPFISVQDKPQVQINKETMAAYRPEMSKYYYDPSRFETYMDQLGIRFPVLQRQAAR